MAIRTRKDGKYQVDVFDQYANRIRKIFVNKSEAKTFEAKIQQIKYDLKLSKNKLKKTRYTFDQGIQDFMLSKINLSPISKKRIDFHLREFKNFLEYQKIIYLDEFTADYASLLFSELIKEKIDPKGNTDKIVKPQPRTVNYFLQTIKSFFHHEIIKDHITRNPMMHIQYLKKEKKEPEFYTEDEIKRFFSQEMNIAYRNAFIGYLLTGMRFSELANLQVKNVVLTKKLIFVRSGKVFKTKTKYSERAIPMNSDLFNLVSELVKGKDQDEYIFQSPSGGQLKERKTLSECKRIALNAGITERAFIHKFRHTFATLLVRKKISLETIKELMGHSSVTITEIYAHNESNNLHKEVEVLNNLI